MDPGEPLLEGAEGERAKCCEEEDEEWCAIRQIKHQHHCEMRMDYVSSFRRGFKLLTVTESTIAPMGL